MAGKARMEARMPLEWNTEWDQVKNEAHRLGVPPQANFKIHVDRGEGTPMDPGYEEIVWSWTV